MRLFRELVGEEIYGRVADYIAQVLRGEPAHFEATIRNGAGAPRRIEATYVPWLDPVGKVLGYYSLIVDRNDSEQNLHLQSMLNGISDGFCTFDQIWRLTYCNKAAERLLGIDAGASLGKTYRELVPSVVGTSLEAALATFGAAQSRLDIESEHLAPGRVLAISVFPVGSSFALSFRDVTVRNAAI